ncbi:MAG: hypothetical protein R2854_10040 [Caldilineaceae bacterium]
MSLNMIYNTAPGLPRSRRMVRATRHRRRRNRFDASITGSIIGQHQTGILVSTGLLRMFNDGRMTSMPLVFRMTSPAVRRSAQFRDADGGDLHFLAASSPLIDGYAYGDVHSQQPVLDIDGTVREEEEPPKNDIGADEFDRGPLVTEDARATPEVVTAALLSQQPARLSIQAQMPPVR